MDAGSEQSGAPPRALGAVLAGGLGSRIGGAKATALLNGRPLILHPLTAVEAAGLEPLVVAKRGSELPDLACPVIHEPQEPRHPLCGIVAALREAAGRPLVAVGCDMPFLDPGLLSWLGAAAEPLVVPMVGGRLQPLLARYDAALLPSLESALDRGEPLQRAIEALRPRLVAERDLARFGDPERLCFNVNDRADLERAEALLARGFGSAAAG